MKFNQVKTLGLAAVVAISVLVPLAYAGGIFQGYPIVGSAAFCNSTNSQSTSPTVPGTLPSNTNCTNTVPAGPTTLTGAETYPADTNLTQGIPPQTVRIPTVMAASGAYATSVPLTGTTINVGTGISNYLANPSGTIAALTVVLPQSPIDGQIFRFATSSTISTISFSGGASGAAVDNSSTTLTVTTAPASMGVAFIYKASANSWYRMM